MRVLRFFDNEMMDKLIFPEAIPKRKVRMTAEDMANKIMNGKNGKALLGLMEEFNLELVQ